MPHRIRTKKALLSIIGNAPTAVQQIVSTTLFRVSVPGDDDPNSGVWVTLLPSLGYMVDDYRAVYARVGGRNVRLSMAETDAVRTHRRGAVKKTYHNIAAKTPQPMKCLPSSSITG
jgi:hypothetical protein